MRRIPLLILVASATAAAAPAHAQGFFERLFGIAPRQPAPPEVTTAPNNPDALPADPAKPKVAPPPVQARPVALRVPTEDGVVGRELKQNGIAGSLRIERVPGKPDLRARLTLAGRRSAQSVETCSVNLGGPDGLPLVSQGRAEGLQRYRLEEAGCALSIDVLDEAVLVKGAGEACVFQAANCQADGSGLWGPDPNQLVSRARDYETVRASADKAVRENYKVLVQRARPEGVRTIVSEQAAFSSDRETTCRTYSREPVHSFCNARFSEARAIGLANRLGVTVASANPAPGGQTRARAPRDPYGLPPTDELVERSPLD